MGNGGDVVVGGVHSFRCVQNWRRNPGQPGKGESLPSLQQFSGQVLALPLHVSCPRQGSPHPGPAHSWQRPGLTPWIPSLVGRV